MNFAKRDFRDALGSFGTGVCVVTANPAGCKPFGMTINSFASVSLEPPLVLWSIQKDSDLFETFQTVTHFGINVLRLEQKQIANIYAKKNDHDLRAEHYALGRTGVPVIKEALSSFECMMDARYDAGDHVIYVGLVKDMTRSFTGKPLIFYAGQYRELH